MHVATVLCMCFCRLYLQIVNMDRLLTEYVNGSHMISRVSPIAFGESQRSSWSNIPHKLLKHIHEAIVQGCRRTVPHKSISCLLLRLNAL